MSYKPKQIETKDIEKYEINMSNPDSYLFIRLPEECDAEYAMNFKKTIDNMMKYDQSSRVVVYSGNIEFKQVTVSDE